MEIPAILYQLRTLNKLSQENVAEELGVDYTTYARYEKGKTDLKLSHAQKLAQLYGLTLDELYNYGEYQVPKKEKTVVQDLLDEYAHKPKKTVSITVELDGSKESETKWIKLISEINKVVKGNMNS